MTDREPSRTANGGEYPPQVRHMPRRDRIIVIAVIIGVLSVSRWLTPAENGFGTHRQLLLLPCIFQAATHLPCPFCGLTTSFALMADGRVNDAFGAHILGPVAFSAMTLYAVLAGLSLLPRQNFAQRLVDLVATPRVTLLIAWLFAAAWPVDIYLFILRHHPYGW